MNKKKSLFKILLAAVIATGLSTTVLPYTNAFADHEEGYTPFVEQLEDGILYENRSLVPLRSVFEALGATVSWDGEYKRITAERHDNKKITLTVDSNKALVNGTEETIDVPAKVFNGKTYVPLRFVSQVLGASVDWQTVSTTRGIATIRTPNKTMKVEVIDVITEANQEEARQKEIKQQMNNWSKEVKKAIQNQEIFTGMTREQVEVSWGKPHVIVPNGIHNVNGEYVVGESWGYVYSTTRYQLDFLNGVLVDIR
ncbi:MAG: stalk domain-containing protein [Solibacillus sp.]